jgi:hypothetical protein
MVAGLVRTIGPGGAAAVVVGIGALIAPVSGCGPQARVQLHQLGYDGQPHTLQLESNWAHFSRNEESGARLLLAWCLPGARVGQKHYLLYLRLPPGDGTLDVGAKVGDQKAAWGFLIQRGGRSAGLSGLERGTITVSGGKNRRTGKLSVECADGTRIQGGFRAVRSDQTVRFFEEEHAADLANAAAGTRKAE